jgi:hypothetical protein
LLYDGHTETTEAQMLLFLVFLWAGLNLHGFVAFCLMLHMWDHKSDAGNLDNIMLGVLWLAMVIFV